VLVEVRPVKASGPWEYVELAEGLSRVVEAIKDAMENRSKP